MILNVISAILLNSTHDLTLKPRPPQKANMKLQNDWQAERLSDWLGKNRPLPVSQRYLFQLYVSGKYIVTIKKKWNIKIKTTYLEVKKKKKPLKN